jgi:predicted dehydrogenase
MKTQINRRDFLHSTAAIGAGLFLTPSAFGQGAAAAAKKDVLNIGLIGAGAQGQVLMDAITKLGKNANVSLKAVCDIWDYNLKRVSRTMAAYKAYGHVGTPYTDFKEMLDKEQLDAVIVASPDFWHAEHSIAALKKGLHVYCEKEMSNDIEKAKQMVLTAREAGKLLQIGHQRRSNPRYIHCYEKYMKEANLLNQVTHIYGQWNRSRSACEDLGFPTGNEVQQAVLEKHGFKDMTQFRNWRWYKGLGGGPIVDLGSHQIDIYSWFLGEAKPISVMASGGVDYWKGHEWYDNVIAIYEFKTDKGIVRAIYQTLTTNSANGYYEQFMGDEGTLVISEASSRGELYRESWVPEAKWDTWVKKKYLNFVEPAKVKKEGEGATDVRESIAPAKYQIPITMDVPYHQPHLVNFFDSVRGSAKLNCPGEVAYVTAAMVLKVNEAVAAGKKIEFKPEEFTV